MRLPIVLLTAALSLGLIISAVDARGPGGGRGPGGPPPGGPGPNQQGGPGGPQGGQQGPGGPQAGQGDPNNPNNQGGPNGGPGQQNGQNQNGAADQSTGGQPCQVMSTQLQDQLNLTATQRAAIVKLQKDMETRLGKILTADQKKQLQQIMGANTAFNAGFNGNAAAAK